MKNKMTQSERMQDVARALDRIENGVAELEAVAI